MARMLRENIKRGSVSVNLAARGAIFSTSIGSGIRMIRTLEHLTRSSTRGRTLPRSTASNPPQDVAKVNIFVLPGNGMI